MPSRTVVGTGLIALDVIYFKDNRDDVTLQAGGSCGNVLSALAWLGWNAKAWGRMGLDANSDLVVKDLNSAGVKTNFLDRKHSFGTPVIHQVNSPRGSPNPTHRFLWKCPDCNTPFPRHQPPTRVDAQTLMAKASPAVFYFDRVSPASIVLAGHYRSKGTMVVFEPNSIRDEKLFERALKVTTILKYSEERMSSYIQDLDECKVKVQVETMGGEGLRFRTVGSKWQELGAIPTTQLVDSAGSGDWVTAGLIDSLHGKPLQAADVRNSLRFGQALASLNCRFVGARGLMRHAYPKEARKWADQLVRDHIVNVQETSAKSGALGAYCTHCTASTSHSTPETSNVTHAGGV